jgi:cell division septal protein FtsQ
MKSPHIQYRRNQKNILPGLSLKKYFLPFILLITTGLCFYQSWYIFYRSGYFRLKKINITGNSVLQTENILQCCGLEHNMLVFRIDFPAVSKKIQRHSPWIKDVKIIQSAPDEIHIQLTERSPFMYLKSESTIFGLTQDGYLLPVPDDLSAKIKPPVEINLSTEELGYSRIFSEKKTKIENWQQTLAESDLADYNSLHFRDAGQITLRFAEINIFLEEPEFFRKHEKKMLSFIQKMKIENNRIDYIDARFDDLVVRFTKAQGS